MSFFIIFIGIVISFVCAAFKRFKLCVGVLLCILVVIFIVGTGILPQVLVLTSLEDRSFYEPQAFSMWDKRNLILILGVGTVKIPETNIIKPGVLAYSRIDEGAGLYHTCKKSGNQCTVLISGGDMLGTGKSEAAVYKDELLRLQVEARDIQLETRSLNTYQNAEYSSVWIKEAAVDRVFLVTAGLHMKRALLYFSHFGIHPIPIPSDYMRTSTSVLPLGYNIMMTDFALHEYMGIIRYYVYQYFGLNKTI